MSDILLYIIYTVLLSTRVILPSFNNWAVIVMIAINIYIYINDKKHSDFALCSSFLMPGEIFPIVNFLVGLLTRMKRKESVYVFKTRKLSALLFIVIMLSSIINAVVNGAVPNLIFYLFYLGIVIFSIRLSNQTMSADSIVKCMKAYVIIEFILTLLIIYKHRMITPGDEFSGSMSSAHWLGNWLIVTLILLSFHDSHINRIKLSLSAIKSNLIYIILVIIMIYLADAKSLLIALAVGTMGYLIFEHKKSYKYSFLLFVVTFCCALFAVFIILYLEPVKMFVCERSSLFGKYLYSEGWNGKFEYIRGTLLEELPVLHLLVGFGLGQYGSRIANIFAYNIMWRADNGINNFVSSFFNSRCIPQYAKYINFYNADFVSQIGWRSAVMSYPFNSVTAMIAETGIIGVIFFAYIFNNYIKASECKILGYYFVVACIFDLYFDNFPCVAIIILIILNTKIKDKR